MTVPSSISETALHYELTLFKEYFGRLRDELLNRIFDLRPEKAARRMWYLFFLLIISGFLISLGFYPLILWMHYARDIFYYLLIPNFAVKYPGDPLISLINFAFQVLRDPRIFQYLPILLASFFIALQSAAIYLADIFELEDVSVARKFVRGVALSGSKETILITKGDIADENRASPNYLIGGPGKVIVDLDSVALFEGPDGTPHVIGPTGKEPKGKATLEGFERFRQAINVRDHFTPLQDQDDKSRSISSRSLDGILVSAVDVQIIFSIFRDNQKPSNENEYPYSKNAVEELVYSSASKVTPDSSQSSTHAFIWENVATGMVRAELGKFMSEQNLTEYLASFGLPEVDKARTREAAIVEEERQVIPPDESPSSVKSVSDSPNFTPRHSISSLFNKFSDNFAKNANRKGVEFSWTGIGTWKTPIKIVTENHIDAWKLTKENMVRGEEKSIKAKGDEAGLQRIIAMIQDVPLGYQGIIHNSPNRKTAIRSLLQEYQRQLRDEYEFLFKNNRRIPPTLVAALAYLFQIFTPSHFVQRTISRAASKREEQLFDDLQNKIGKCNGVVLYNAMEQLIQLERKFDPTATREELLDRVIHDWDRDIIQ